MNRKIYFLPCLLCLLCLTAKAQTETEPNNSFATANELPYNTPSTGTIGCSGDADDYYKVEIPLNKKVRVYLEYTNTGASNGSVYFHVYAKNQGGIVTGRYSGSIVPAATVYDTLDMYCRDDDSMYLRIQQNSQCISYKIQYEVEAVPALAFDSSGNDSYAAAVYFSEGDTIKGTIRYNANGVDDNEDYFVTKTPRDGLLRVYIERTNTSNNNNGYFYLNLDNNNQSNFHSGYHGFVSPGDTRTDTIDIYCRTADTVYFRLNSATTCFSYTLRYEVLNNHPLVIDTVGNDSYATAVYFSEGDTIKGTIKYNANSVDDNEDYFVTKTPRDGLLRVYIERTNTSSANGQYFYLNLDNNNQSNFYSGYHGFVSPGATRTDTIDIYCRTADTVYFRLNSATTCFSYTLHYEVLNNHPLAIDTVGNDSYATAVYFSEGDTIKGTIKYNANSVSDDNDYFVTQTPRDGLLRVYIERTNTSSANGQYFYLNLDNKNQSNFYSDYHGFVSPGATRTDTVDIYCRTADTVYFRLNGATTCFSYTLRYEVLNNHPLAIDTVGNDGYATAVYFSEGDTIKGTIKYNANGVSDDNDYFVTQTPRDGLLRVYIERTNTSNNNNGYFYLNLDNKNQSNFYSDYHGFINPGATRTDTVDIYCRTADTVYFRLNGATTCFSYTLRYEVILGGDTTLNVCPGFTTDISNIYNTQPFNVVNWTNMGGGAMPPLTAVGAGLYRLTVENTSYACSKDTAFITVGLYPKPDLGNDTMANVCPGFTADLTQFKNTTGLTPQWLGASNPTAVDAGTYTMIVSNVYGCMDTAVITIGLHPKPDLGNDTMANVCPGFTVDLTQFKDTTGLSAQWLGASDPTAVGVGTYTMIVTNVYGCMDTAVITIGLHPKPDLGNDTMANVCPGFTADLTQFKDTTGLSVQWLGASDPTSAGAGTYTMIVTNVQGCTDTAVIIIGLHPKPDLGNDTTANVCPGFTADLTQFKDTTGLSAQWLGASDPTAVGVGTYTMIVTNVQGCMDTAVITIGLHPKPDLGNDTVADICPGFTADLTQFKDTTGLSAQWLGASDPTAVGVGTYTMIVTNVQGCMDTAVITIGLHPKPDLGNDTTANVCPGFTADLTQFKNTTGLTPQWLGTSDPTAVDAGTYTMIVTNVQGCMDTAVITIGLHPKPDLGNDTTANICPGFTADLTQFKNTTGLTTQWLGTSIPTTVGVGTYTLIVTNVQGCTDTAVITIGLHPKPDLGNDTTANICPGFTADLTQFKNTTGLTTQWLGTSTPTSVGSGTYTLIVTNAQGCSDTAIIIINNSTLPNLGNDTTFYAWIGETVNFVTIKDTTGFAANGWTHSWFSNINGVSGNTIITMTDTDTVYASLSVYNQNGCGDTVNITIYPVKQIVPPSGITDLSADVEITAPDGWTHYYHTNNTATKADDILLLSLKKNGNNIGSTGVGSFMVKNVATQNAGTNTGVQITNPLMSNSSDYYAMHRYWQVTLGTQPTSSVGVRFYFNTQDYNDANGSFGNTKTIQQLVLYHLKDGDPDPTSNWSGATLPVVSIMHDAQVSDTTWIYTSMGNNQHYAEFTVSSFSGGGAGFTGNNGPLPVTITSFTAVAKNDDAVLDWHSADESNIARYEIQRSEDGKHFSSLYTVKALNEKAANYHYTDAGAGKLAESLYYRVKVHEANGSHSFTKVVPVRFSRAADEITLFPNPAKDELTLKGVKEYRDLKVTDIHGKVVLSRKITGDTEVLQLHQWATGTYTVTLGRDGQSKTLKFIKNE